MTATTDDEFALLAENAADAGLAWHGRPAVARVDRRLDDGRVMSSILWGDDPELVFLHGGGQNAHTWDTVVLAMGRSALAVDLPGHGRSDRPPEPPNGTFDPAQLAADVVPVVRELAPRARLVTGMSLGGLTAIVLASRTPELVPRLAVVDVMPGVSLTKASTQAGRQDRGPAPESYASQEEMVAEVVAGDPDRSESSMRRGVHHNSCQLPNGRWVWRGDRHRRDDEGYALAADGSRVVPGTPLEVPGTKELDRDAPLYPELWDDVSALTMPTLLVLGSRSGACDAQDCEELLRRQPTARVVTVDGAGHRVQGDRPIELAALLEELLTQTAG